MTSTSPKSRRLPIKRLALLAAALLLAVAGIRPGDRSLAPNGPDDSVTVFVINNGFHTDLAASAVDLQRLGGPTATAAQALSEPAWVAIGWGDASFYSNTGFSAARVVDALRAAFMPGNASVVHLYRISRPPDQAFDPGVATPVVLSKEGFRRLVARADRSFALENGALVPGPARDADEAFFKSTEHFSILKICNHWTADLLNAGGQRVLLLLDTAPRGLLFDLSLNR